MKLGYINYANCYPFYYKMFNQEPIPGIEIIEGYPSDLNHGIKQKQLDMSPVSSIIYAEVQKETSILPDFCLSSIGYVGSVMLMSKVPIEDLNHKRIGLTSASQTSVVLLKILLKKFYDIEPEYQKTDPFPNLEHLDAALVIGNEAMLDHPKPIPFIYDIGELWLRKTGFPVVFAIFLIHDSQPEENKSLIKKVIGSYGASLLELDRHKAAVIQAAQTKYPQIKYNLSDYYGFFRFEFTATLKEALRYYYQMASDMGFIPPVKTLRFYTP